MIKLKKGSKEAKQFMAKLRAKRKMSGNNKRVYIDFYNKKKNFKQDRKYFKSDEEAKRWALKNLQKFDIDMIKEESANLGKIKVKRKISGNPRRETQHKDTKSHNVNIRVLSGFFDTSVIKELDDLKKQYLKLAKKYHPDAGGTTAQFQDLQNEYEKLFDKIIQGSALNNEQKQTEIQIDEAIREVINKLILIEGIDIELIGKWLWITGNTYPVKDALKSAGLIFIKKDNKPYWIYKGVESAGRGKLSIEEIKQKYGSHKIEKPKGGKFLSGLKINKTSLKTSLKKLLKALNKRAV